MIPEDEWIEDRTCLKMIGHAMSALGIEPGQYVILQRGLPIDEGSKIAYSVARDPGRIRVGMVDTLRQGEIDVYSQRAGAERIYEVCIEPERVIGTVVGVVRSY